MSGVTLPASISGQAELRSGVIEAVLLHWDPFRCGSEVFLPTWAGKPKAGSFRAGDREIKKYFHIPVSDHPDTLTTASQGPSLPVVRKRTAS